MPRVQIIFSLPTLARLICVSGLKPQLFSVRRHISQSAGSGFCKILSVTGMNGAGAGCAKTGTLPANVISKRER